MMLDRYFSRRWVFALALAYFVGLVILTPATLVGKLVERVSGGGIVLAHAEGTLWQGSGELVTTQRGLGIGGLSWHFPAKAWLSGRLQLNIQLAGQEGVVFADWRGLGIDQLRLDAPLESLYRLVPVLPRYGIDGMATLSFSQLRLSLRGLTGQIVAELHNLQSAIIRVNPLGSYRVELIGEGMDSRLMVNTHPGSALQFEGNGAVSMGGKASFQGAVSTTPDKREQLLPLLQLMGGGNEPIPVVFETGR